MNTGKLTLTILALSGAAALTASAQLNLWNVNFAGNSNEGTENPLAEGLVLAAGSHGANQWNNIIAPQRDPYVPAEPLSMVDANGGNPFNLTWVESGNPGHHLGRAGDLEDDLFIAYFGRGTFNTTLQMSGLDTDATYDVFVYFTWSWDASQTVDYSITAGTGDDLAITLVTNRATANYADMAEGSNYVIFSDISPDGTGAIHLNATSGNGGFSAVQLSQVPEPSTYAAILGALALIGAFCVRRRRRNA